MPVTVYFASDHAGFELKGRLLTDLSKQSAVFKCVDLGPASATRCDYPEYAKKLSGELTKTSDALGVLICGSGIGMSIAANKFSGIRAAHVSDPVSARLAREHNNANVICLGSRFLAPEYAFEILETFLNTSFTGDPRHQARIDLISSYDQGMKS